MRGRIPRGVRVLWRNNQGLTVKVALRFSGVNFVSLNFIDYVSMALCMGTGGVRADALGSVLQVHVGRFWGLLGWDTFLVSDLGWETGFGLLSPS